MAVSPGPEEGEAHLAHALASVPVAEHHRQSGREISETFVPGARFTGDPKPFFLRRFVLGMDVRVRQAEARQSQNQGNAPGTAETQESRRPTLAHTPSHGGFAANQHPLRSRDGHDALYRESISGASAGVGDWKSESRPRCGMNRPSGLRSRTSTSWHAMDTAPPFRETRRNFADAKAGRKANREANPPCQRRLQRSSSAQKKVAFFRIFVYAISRPLTDVNRHV